jgi:pyruvate/2-oxoglutarate dehydrogenase complex dihydrolipoamide dehydrogenase (E3) component
MNHRFDAIIIGSGQAGPALAARLTAAKLSVAFIEREHFGGTCVNDGCIPTKALVASGHAAFVARRHADFGVTIGGAIGVDMKAVKARTDAIVQASVNGVTQWVKGMPASPDRTRSLSTMKRSKPIRSSSMSAADRRFQTGPHSVAFPISPTVAS